MWYALIFSPSVAMEKVDIAIIGAGIIGIAVAERLSGGGADVLLLEKEHAFGQHASSRNSEVIHSGIYYREGSLKARLCVRGNMLLYDFLNITGVPYRKCGKLVMASRRNQIPSLERLMKKGTANGVQGLEIIPSRKIQEREPLIQGCAALWVPSTGILDSHALMKKMITRACQKGLLVSYNSEVCGITREGDGYILSFKEADFRVRAHTVVNAAGLWSDRVCALAGLDTQSLAYTLQWNKGEYYKTSRYKGLAHLVYPLPDPHSSHLGIHTVSNLAGELSFGPNAYDVHTIDYSVDGRHHDEFLRGIRCFLPVERDDIWPDTSGIRARLRSPGGRERDFIVHHEKDRGLPNFISLVGFESPGLTCCLSTAEFVSELIA